MIGIQDQYFGTEIEMTGITRQRAAEVVNEHIFKMDEQICRALIIHQLLGTRISDTLTLKTDCLSMRNNR